MVRSLLAVVLLHCVHLVANGLWFQPIPFVRSRLYLSPSPAVPVTVEESQSSRIYIPFTRIKKYYSWCSSSVTGNSSKPISEADESKIIPILVRKNEYISNVNLETSRKEEIKDYCESTDMSFEQALSLRKQLLVEKIAFKTQSMMKRFDKLNRLYHQGESVVSLSAGLDIPAMALMRLILLTKLRENHHRLQLRDRFYRQIVQAALRIGEVGSNEEIERDKEDRKAHYFKGIISEIFTERDIAEVAEAKICDQISYTSMEDSSMEKTSSLGWENQLFDWLRQNNVSFLDESALRQYNISSTPDVLLLDDVYIDGKLVRWMDLKCYYGSSASKIFLVKLRQQNQRYLKEFSGSGAFVYKLSFSEGLKKCISDTEGSLLLDQGPLRVDIKL